LYNTLPLNILAYAANKNNLCFIFAKYLAAKDIAIIFAVRKKKCRVGQGVKTPPFHGGITGSIPVRGTKQRLVYKPAVFYLVQSLKNFVCNSYHLVL
jgi:hypothetical protein